MFAVQPPAIARVDVRAMVQRVRELALDVPRRQIALAFGDDERSAATDHLTRFALAIFDGAFVASRANPATRLERILEPLAPPIVAARRRLLARSN
jgi:hypothetical protein